MILKTLVTGCALGLAALAAPCMAGASASAIAGNNMELAVRLPLRNVDQLGQLIALQSNPRSPEYRHWLSPSQFRTTFGAPSAAIVQTVAAIRKHGFTVTSVDSQLIKFSGSPSLVEREFATRLRTVRFGRLMLRGATSYSVPADLTAAGGKFLGLEAIAPRIEAAERSSRASGADARVRDNRSSEYGQYWFDDLKQAYAFPANNVANGAGVRIANVTYDDVSQPDVDAYYAHERLGGTNALAPEPSIVHVYTGNSRNGIGNDAGPTYQAERGAGSAPGATYYNYADSSYPFFTSALSTIVSNNAADIVQVLGGYCEAYFSPAYQNGDTSTSQWLQAYHSYFMQGNSEGITFVTDTGEDAGLPCAPVGYLQNGGSGIVYPAQTGSTFIASDPNITAVGFTNLESNYNTKTTSSYYMKETTYANKAAQPFDELSTGNSVSPHYFGSGGGVSGVFAIPDYQQNYGLTYKGRSTPDVAMEGGGCPHSFQTSCNGTESRDVIYFNGATTSGAIGGIGAAAQFAALLAVKEQVIGSRLGQENYDIYSLAANNANFASFHQAIAGNNGLGGVSGGISRYNQISGVGSPIGNNFVGLPNAMVAADPMSASNP